MNRITGSRMLIISAALILAGLFTAESNAQLRKPKEITKEMKAKLPKPKKSKPLSIESITETEPNDSIAAANPLPIDSVMEAVINPIGDVDYFKINVTAGQTLAIDIDAEMIGSELDSYLELFDSSGTLLAENDDDGMWLDSKIIHTFADGGNYYIKVTDLGEWGGEDYYYFLRAYEFQTQGSQNMSIVHSWAVPNAAYLIRKDGNILYTVETNEEAMYSVFKTWNVSDLNNPILLDTLYNSGMISDLRIAFNKAYLAMTDNEMGIKILNISNPADIQIDTMLDIGETTGLFILGDKLYDTGDGFTVRDLTNPASPLPLWSFNLEDEDGSFITADEDYVYFTATDGLLRIVDQTTQQLVGSIDAYADLFIVVKPYIYYTAFDNLFTIDITDPVNPVTVNVQNLGYQGFHWSALPHSGYLSAGNYGIQSFSFTEPDMPLLEGYYYSMSDFFPFCNVAENDMVFAASGHIEGWGATPAANRIVILKNDLIGVPDKQKKEKPASFELYGNYPNPFNPSTTIRYRLNNASQISLKIYNILGQEIRTLVSGVRPAGMNEVLWDGKNDKGANVSSGLYLYRLQISNHAITRKMTLLK